MAVAKPTSDEPDVHGPILGSVPALERQNVVKEPDAYQMFDDMPGWKIAFILIRYCSTGLLQ